MSREQFQRKPLKFCGLAREKRVFEMHSHRSASRSERFSIGRPLAPHMNPPPNDIPAGKASSGIARLERLKKWKEEKTLKKMGGMRTIKPPFKPGGKSLLGSLTSTSILKSNSSLPIPVSRLPLQKPQSSLPKPISKKSKPQSFLPKPTISRIQTQQKTGSIVSKIANPVSTQIKLKGNISKSIASQVKTQSKIVKDGCHKMQIQRNEVATDAFLCDVSTIEPIKPRKSFAPDNFVFSFSVEPVYQDPMEIYLAVKAELSNKRSLTPKQKDLEQSKDSPMQSTPIKVTEGETHSVTNKTIVMPKNLQVLPDNGAGAFEDNITEQESDIVIPKDVHENSLQEKLSTRAGTTIEDKAKVKKGFRPLQLESIAECSESPAVTPRRRGNKLPEGFTPRRSLRLAQKIACKDTIPSQELKTGRTPQLIQKIFREKENVKTPQDCGRRHVTLRHSARSLKLSESCENIFDIKADLCSPDASSVSGSPRPSCSNLIEGIEDLHLDNTFQVFDPVNSRKISLLGTPPRKGRRSGVLKSIGQDLISFSPF